MATAIIFSGVNIFSLHLVEFLLTNSCQVYVVSYDHEDWKKQLEHLSHNPNLVIFADNRYLPPAANYVFSVNGIGLTTEKKYTESEIENYISWAIDYANTYGSKACFVLPYLLANDYEQLSHVVYIKQKANLPQKSFTVFLGELYGTRMQFTDGGLITRVIKETIFKGLVVLPSKNQNVYYLYVDDAVKEVVKKLFSFGFPHKEIVLAESDNVYNFFNNLLTIRPGVANVQEDTPEIKTVNNKKFVIPETKKKDSLRHTLVWLSQYATEPKELEEQSKTKQPSPSEIFEPQVYTKHQEKKAKNQRSWLFVFVGVIALMFLIASPFISLFISAFGFKYAYDQVKNGDLTPVKRIAILSSTLATFSKAGLTTFTGFPVGRDFFVFSKDAASALQLSGKILTQAISLQEETANLMVNIVNDESLDLSSKSEKLSMDSQELYNLIFTFNSQAEKLPPGLKAMLPIGVTNQYTEFLLGVSKLSTRLPVLLGMDKPKTYLVLVQNNLELRPTGGEIGAFALVSFDHGKLTDIKVTDVSVADGQLVGKVDPPESLKKSLGESNFWFKDSNWDPDFIVSAQKAEWF
ncbi:DUF4012 domain-containing protein, partial [Candidatus Microgenomates bacterium]|nr:DUF4012 domain-containing protein [Candidatus Microgenomates bacterium]